MRKPLLFNEKRFLRFLSKPILTLLAIIFMALNISAQSGNVVSDCICMSNQTFKGNGQFQTLLRVTNGGAGPWYIANNSSSGLFANPSPLPPAAPDTFATGPGGQQMTSLGAGVFELSGIHIDGQGFSIRLTDGSSDTLDFAVAQGVCQYPQTEIIGDPFVCEGQISDYLTQPNALSSYNWTLDHGGTIATVTNTNEITIEWDANSNGAVHHLNLEETSANGCIVNAEMDVEIEDTITLACNNSVQISLDANCAGELTADMFLEDPQYNNESYELIIKDENGVILNQDTLSDVMIGNNYEVTVRHLCSGNMCWSHMLVLDKTAPELKCETDTIKCSESADPRHISIGFPLVYYTNIYNTNNPFVFRAEGTSGCSDVMMRYYDEVNNGDCGDEFASIIIRTWIVTDLSGNLSTCIDTIKTTKTGMNDISYPVNWDGLAGNHAFIEACSSYPKDHNGNPAPSLTGSPTGPLCGNIMINYSDHNRLELCSPDANSYKVLRQWTVMDMCTGESFDTLQIIAVMDTKSPKVSFSGLINNTLTVETENYNCGSDVILPIPQINDCSSTHYSVGYQLADETGNYPPFPYPYTTLNPSGGAYKIPDVPGGKARVKYTVVDACGNQTEKIIFIQVVDNLPPQAVCDAHTTITLTDEGLGYLGKLTFDDGSYDNCTDISLRVRRLTSTCDPTDTQWGEGVHFCCQDLLETSIKVILEVTDGNGFTNTCKSEVYVQDKEIPKIVCPSNGIVSCKFDYSDLSVFGTIRTSQDDIQKIYVNDPENGGNHTYFGIDGYGSDNCDVIVETLNSNVSINNCGIGKITRKFRVHDGFGNKSPICTQTITVQDFDPFTPNYDLIWPANYTKNGCLDEGILPDNLPIQYGWPRITGDDHCSMIAMDYDDLTFEHVEGMCYKILRKWKVIDWCQYDQNAPNNTAGYWEYDQTIMITDGVDPIVTQGCTPYEIVPLGDCSYRYKFEAEGTDNCTNSEYLRWSYKIYENSPNNVIIVGDGNKVVVTLTKGNYGIVWYAEDNCGNVGQCSKSFTVKDEKAPTPQCIDGLVTVLLEETGQVTLNAADFNRSSTDDCTRSNYGACGCLTDLRFSFSSNVNNTTRTLTCADIENGISDTIELRMYVTDESGNNDFCNTYIVLQDNADVCTDVLPPHDTTYNSISGLVFKPNDDIVEDVDVRLYSEDPEFPISVKTNEEGEFAFSQLPDNYNYSLKAEKRGDDGNGISTLDIVLMQKHILGIKKINNPYKLIAADVNNSGSVSASDILETRKLILGESDNFKNNDSWKFLKEGHIFEDENHPYISSSQAIYIGNLKENTKENFIAIKIGDLNYSAVTSPLGLESRNTDSYKFITNDVSYNRGDEVDLILFTENFATVAGTQFTLEFDASELNYKGIENGLIKMAQFNINKTMADQGIITISWNEEQKVDLDKNSELLKFRFSAIKKGNLSDNVKISSKITQAEIYTYSENKIEEKNLELEYRNLNKDYTFEVYQNAPNPFSNKTVVGFVLPESQTATLKVYSMTGKLIFESIGDFSKGYNEFKIDKKDISTTGLMYYKLEAGQNSALRKMILIK